MPYFIFFPPDPLCRVLCGNPNSPDPVFREQADGCAVFYLDYLVLQEKTLAALHDHYFVMAVTCCNFPMTQPWAAAPDTAGRDGKLKSHFVCLPLCFPGGRIRAAACARSTSTSGGTSTGSGSTSQKVTQLISVLVTVRTSGVPTTTTTW